MAEACPFRGIRYNREIVGDLAAVICPPYDVISPEQQKLYCEKSDYNAIRLEFPPVQPGDNDADNKYSRAATTLQQWLKQGIIEIDDHPAFYLHDHYFDYLGKRSMRRGLIARVKLEPWGSGIYPHEETTSRDKSDRLQVMRACRANFSPLLSLYQDSRQKIAPILSEVAQGKSIIEISVPSPLVGEGWGEGGESHIVWAITDAKSQQLSRFLSAQALYMADGHHRYETALEYQRERTRGLSSVTGKEAFDYVMMELVEFSDPGLVILPLHRLVRGIAPSVLSEVRNLLENFFTLEFVPLATDSYQLTADSCLGVLGLAPESLVLLKQRPGVSVDAMMPDNRSQAYREFGISLLNHVILDKLLGGTKGLDIAYTVDVDEDCQRIRKGEYQLAFLPNSSQPEVVKAIVDARDRMPRKSTYFYPKLPAGLIINSTDQQL